MKVESGDRRIDGLLIDQSFYSNGVSSWHRANELGTPVTISYSFMTFRPFGSDPDITGFQAMRAAQEAAVQNILAMFETFANVTFVQNPDGFEADIQFGTAALNSVGFGTKGITYLSWDNFAGNTTYGWLDDVDVYLTNDDAFEGDEYDNPQPDTFAYSVLVHEIGHALGLEHPFEGVRVPAGTDNTRYTIMSYTDGFTQSEEPFTIMPYDVLALQYLYGANTSTNSGDTTYDMASYRDGSIQTIWDAGGSDTVDLSGITTPGPWNGTRSEHTVDLMELIDTGAKVFVSGDMLLEDVIGSDFADFISGTDFANDIAGGGGNDIILSRGGDDTVTGGSGADEFSNSGGNDTFSGGSGADIAIGQGGQNDFSGDGGNDTLFGASGRDDLNGGAGNDLLSGDGYSVYFGGADSLDGGAGDDKLMGGLGADTFVFRPNDGNDTIAAFDLETQAIEGRDFDPGQDKIALVGFGYASATDALADFRDTTTGVIFENVALDSTVTIYGVNLDELGADNIILDDLGI